MKKATLLFLILIIGGSVSAQFRETQNVIIVTLDGSRWQEIYRGADSSLINSKYTKDKEEVRENFWAETVEERRKLLMPFMWSTMVRGGQLYGNRDIGNKSEVANKAGSSYPGYNEIFTGAPDWKIMGNAPINNTNKSVLEYINKQPGFENEVVVFASWELFPYIFNVKQSGLKVNAGYTDVAETDANGHIKYLNELQHTIPHPIGETRVDTMTYELGKAYLKQYKPRIMYFAFDETDEMGHRGNYQSYLNKLRQQDGFIKELWLYIQTDSTYRNKTTLIITCDHGRGDASPWAWTEHSILIKNSIQTWMAVIGPDTPAEGEMGTSTTIYQKQIAQTIAKLLGFDFKANTKRAIGDPIESITRKDVIVNVAKKQ
ncbi:MAG: alkaline phosphatase family protein [Mucilaginibacter sp.]